MENQTQVQTSALSVVCQKKHLSEIYKGGRICDVDLIEQITKLPNNAFFDLVYSSEKIKDHLNDQYFRSHLGGVLTVINALSGIKSELDVLIKRDILNTICSYYKNLSVAEIYKAFQLERAGMYDEKTDHFQLFDSTYISSILKKYENWKSEQKRMSNYNPPQIEQKQIESPKKEDIEKTRLEFLQLLFESLKNDGFYDYAWILYSELKAQKKIIISEDDAVRLYQTELKRYSNSVKNNSTKSVSNKTQWLDLARIIENKQPVKIVQNRCQSILVCKYLKPFLEDFETFKKSIINQ